MAKNIYITENQFRKILESAGDLEYHFTPLENLCGMMEDDALNLTDSGYEEGRNGSSFISLSRLRSSAAGYGWGMTRLDKSAGPVARIEFDGRKLNNVRNVNVRPYNYFYNNIGRTWKGRENSGSDASEFEDSLTLKDGRDQIVDAIDYITRIDVYLPDYCPKVDVWERFLNDLEEYGDWAEKMHFYTDLNGFDYQRNEIPRSEIYGVYSGQMKNALEENKRKMGKSIYITESQLSRILAENGIIDEHVAVIDNTKDVEKLISMQWTSPDDYWFIQVTQRKKDFRNYNKRHGGNSKWWNRVQGIDGTSRENFAGYGVVKGNTLQDAIDCLHNIKIKLNPWAAQIIGQNEVKSNGNMEAIYDICDKLWARAYITINKRSMSRTQRIAQKGGLRAFEKESSRNHSDAQYYPWSMIDMDIDDPNAASDTDSALSKLKINPAIRHSSHDGTHYFFNNRDIMKYSEHSPEFSPIARKYAGSKQPGEAFTMKEDAKMIIYSPCGQ